MVLSMKMTGRFIVVNIYIKPWHCYDKPQSVTITNLCVTQSVWFAPAYVGYRIFFSLKRFSTTDGHDSGTRIKLCCRVHTDEGRGTKLCFILSKTWVTLLAAAFCFTFSLPILIFQGSLFLNNMFEIALKLIMQIVIIHQHQNKLIYVCILSWLSRVSVLFNQFNLQCTCICSSLEYRFDVCFKQNWSCIFAMSLQCHLGMIIFRKENTYVC